MPYEAGEISGELKHRPYFKMSQLCVLLHTCNAGTWKAEVGGAFINFKLKLTVRFWRPAFSMCVCVVRQGHAIQSRLS